jgi:hypothetical protein
VAEKLRRAEQACRALEAEVERLQGTLRAAVGLPRQQVGAPARLLSTAPAPPVPAVIGMSVGCAHFESMSLPQHRCCEGDAGSTSQPPTSSPSESVCYLRATQQGQFLCLLQAVHTSRLAAVRLPGQQMQPVDPPTLELRQILRHATPQVP